MAFDLASINAVVGALAAIIGAAGGVYVMRAQITELGRRVHDLASETKKLAAGLSVCESSLLEQENKMLREMMLSERRLEEKFVTLAEHSAIVADLRRRMETLEQMTRN